MDHVRLCELFPEKALPCSPEEDRVCGWNVLTDLDERRFGDGRLQFRTHLKVVYSTDKDTNYILRERITAGAPCDHTVHRGDVIVETIKPLWYDDYSYMNYQGDSVYDPLASKEVKIMLARQKANNPIEYQTPDENAADMNRVDDDDICF